MTLPNSPPAAEAADACPASFADALALIEANSATSPKDIKTYRSAVATLGRVTGRLPGDLPLSPSTLRPLLEAVLPARFRMSRKRWANVRSALAAIAARTGHVTSRAERRVPLGEVWASAMAPLPRTPQSAALNGFARFCQVQGIMPAAVDETALEAYRAFLIERTYELDPGTTINSVRRMWNIAAGTIEGWPGRKLLPPRNPHVRALRLEAFPASFAEELGAYLARLAAPDPFDQPFGDGPIHVGRPLSPVTIADRRRILLRAASILVEAGEPIERMTGLAVLTTEAAMRTVLTDLHHRKGNAWTGNAVTMAMVLFDVARRHVRLDKTELDRLHALKKQVTHRYPGLGDRVRARLSQFDDARMLRDLLGLPRSLFEAADKLLRDGCPARAASVHEAGLALALLLLLPIRRRNLAALDFQRHLVRHGQGRVVLLRIPAAEVKNGITLEAEVPQELARRLDRHIRIHRPALARTMTTTTWLFPGQGEGHRCPEVLANKVSKAVRNAVGAEFNLHLVRHLVATLLYDADTGNGPVVQRQPS